MEWALALGVLLLFLRRGGAGAGAPSNGAGTGGLLGTPTGTGSAGAGGLHGTPTGTSGAKKAGFAASRPPGNPPGNCQSGGYDVSRWNSRASILDAFGDLGYAIPEGRDTMNDLGPDGKLGGGDDLPSAEVMRFQANYNTASGTGLLGAGAGGLDRDGKVGPCTLAALGVALDRYGPDAWSTRFDA